MRRCEGTALVGVYLTLLVAYLIGPVLALGVLCFAGCVVGCRVGVPMLKGAWIHRHQPDPYASPLSPGPPAGYLVTFNLAAGLLILLVGVGGLVWFLLFVGVI